MHYKEEKKTVRINGYLKQVTSVKDKTGKVIHSIVSPLMVEFYARDVMQVIIGASILAIPVGFTEETWNLGAQLPWSSIITLIVVSLLFIAGFTYMNIYLKNGIKKHWDEFLKRTFITYILAFLVVAFLLFVIQKAPFTTDIVLAFKRVAIVAFPASMSAAVADMVK